MGPGGDEKCILLNPLLYPCSRASSTRRVAPFRIEQRNLDPTKSLLSTEKSAWKH